MAKPKIEWGGPTVCYMTRHMPVSMLERIRVLAALRECTVEEIVNAALAVGVAQLERRK